MLNFIFLFIGLISGGIIACVLISCFQLGKINEYEREIERLKSIANKKNL